MSIIKPIAQLLGYILDILFKGLNAIGIGNIAIAIIIFTLLVKMLMLPLQIKQQKMTKLQSVMNPEIKAIQEKYKGKNSDTVAMQKMQAETKAVYEKYGVSQWGSCVQLLIQMPILFALYRVFQQMTERSGLLLAWPCKVPLAIPVWRCSSAGRRHRQSTKRRSLSGSGDPSSAKVASR